MSYARNILWTSGWDSTFRLLYSLIIDKVTVQPIYVVDSGRGSTFKELKSIFEIINSIQVEYPEEFKKLKPLLIIYEDYKNRKEYAKDLEDLAKLPVRFGSQHAWLPIILKDNFKGNDVFEISMHDLSDTSEFLKQYLNQDKYGNYIMSEDSPDEIIYFFGIFKYPLIYTSKLEMKKLAIEYGFIKLMRKTWFCHDPILKYPCGMCNPCKDAKYKYGMRDRLPTISLYLTPFLVIIRRVYRKLIKIIANKK